MNKTLAIFLNTKNPLYSVLVKWTVSNVIKFIYFLISANSGAVRPTTNGSHENVEEAAPSEASTQSADSEFSGGYDDDGDDEVMTLPDMLEEFERYEQELYEISTILQLMSAKTCALKAQLQKIIENQQWKSLDK